MKNWKDYWQELQRRHVVKAGIAYLVVAWLLVQVLDILLDAFQLDSGWMQTAIIILSVGFPIWLILAWIYDFSWGSIQKTEDVTVDAEVSRKKNIILNRVIIGGLSIAVILLVVNTLRLTNKIEFEEDGRLNLAVLPFDNFSPDPSNEWMGDGFTEDIITHLGRLDEFKVISRTSVMQYKKLDHSIPRIAKGLDVSHIIEGSIRKEGEDILVTIKLVNSEDELIWNDQIRKRTGNILDLQSDVAARVSAALLGELTEAQKEILDNDKVIDPEAQRQLTLGDRIYDRMSTRHMAEAQNYYAKALEIEPDWEEALSRLAFTIAWSNPSKADSLAKKALLSNSKSDQAWAARAIANIEYNLYDKAESLLLNAININQDAPWSHDMLASMYLFRKPNFEKAYFHANEAAKMDPLNLYFLRRQMFALIYLERFNEMDSLMREKKLFIDEEVQSYIQRLKISKMAEVAAREAQDYGVVLQIFQSSIDTIPSESPWYRYVLAEAYNNYYNDNEKFLQEIQRSWQEREKIRRTPAGGPPILATRMLQALVENGNLVEARNFVLSKGYLNEFENNEIYSTDRSKVEWSFAIHMKDFQSAENLIGNDAHLRILTDAHTGQLEKVRKALNRNEYSDPTLRARVYAIIKERDSLFHYLNKETIDAPFVNSNPDFDPYRKDSRFIDFRKRHYLRDVSIE